VIKKLLIAGNLLVIAVSSYFVVSLVYRFALASLPPAPPPREVVLPSGPAQADAVLPQSAYRVVVERDLFRTSTPTEAPPPQTDLAALEATKLQVRLLGTITSTGTRNWAVIEDTRKKEEDLYTVGDVVAGASIKEIHRGKIVLNLKGKDEILLMEDVPHPGGDDDSVDVAVAETPASFRLRRSEMERHMMNLPQLMSQVRIRPSFDNGQPDGLAVTRIQPGSIFSEMGLQDGDVIQGVNGNEIRSVEDIMALYRSMRQSESLALQVKRAGLQETLTYAFE
jgi:general secretion pathway protein C